jgi:hypothetical protein
VERSLRAVKGIHYATAARNIHEFRYVNCDRYCMSCTVGGDITFGQECIFLYRPNPFHVMGDRWSPSRIAELPPKAHNIHHFSFKNFVRRSLSYLLWLVHYCHMWMWQFVELKWWPMVAIHCGYLILEGIEFSKFGREVQKGRTTLGRCYSSHLINNHNLHGNYFFSKIKCSALSPCHSPH